MSRPEPDEPRPAAGDPEATVRQPAAPAHPADPCVAPTVAARVGADVTVAVSGRASHAPPTSHLGRYPIAGELGQGGMGQVLEVTDPDLGRRIAAKVMTRGQRDPALVRKFVVEAQVTGQLEHPNIVPVYELGLTSDGTLYFTMKRVEGQTLEDLLCRAAGAPPGLLQLMQIFLKVCDAVAFAHSRGVIHRDLKPANIMVGQFGEVQVMDWGLARVAGVPDQAVGRLAPAIEPGTGRIAREAGAAGEILRTLDGSVMGTPAYMSPEQAAGKVAELDERADIYALGAILYQILAGVQPYGGDTPLAILKKVLKGPPRPPSRRAPKGAVPWELEAVVLRAMNPVRARRYQRVDQMKADVEAHLEGRALAAARYSTWQLLRKWAARHKAGVTAAALTLTAALAAGVVAFAGITRQKSIAEAREQDAQRQRKLAEENARQAAKNNRLARQAGRIQEITDLEAEAAGLYPAVPEKVAAMEAWLARAKGVATDFPADRRALDELKRRADLARDPQARWLHGVLAGLAKRGQAFADPDPWKGTLAGVEKRLAWARIVRARSLEAHREAWDRAIAEIADPRRCPPYRGLRLAPQLGLVPLGRDPQSGLAEFAHLETGEPARRGADGKLVIGSETSLVFVLLPGGTFRMGAVRPSAERPLGSPNVDPQAGVNEGPVHEVTLGPFFLSKYEMTQGQWLRVTGGNPSHYKNPHSNPVEQVSWEDCEQVMRRLGLILPTEAQWEYAARGGTGSVWWTGNDVRSLQGAANIADRFAARFVSVWIVTPEVDDGHAYHAAVGRFKANAWGMLDMAGNVSEWCRDEGVSYQLAVHGSEGLRTLKAGAALGLCATRGGSFSHSAAFARSAQRACYAPTFRNHSIGLRPGRVIPNDSIQARSRSSHPD